MSKFIETLGEERSQYLFKSWKTLAKFVDDAIRTLNTFEYHDLFETFGFKITFNNGFIYLAFENADIDFVLTIVKDKIIESVDCSENPKAFTPREVLDKLTQNSELITLVELDEKSRQLDEYLKNESPEILNGLINLLAKVEQIGKVRTGHWSAMYLSILSKLVSISKDTNELISERLRNSQIKPGSIWQLKSSPNPIAVSSNTITVVEVISPDEIQYSRIVVFTADYLEANYYLPIPKFREKYKFINVDENQGEFSWA